MFSRHGCCIATSARLTKGCGCRDACSKPTSAATSCIVSTQDERILPSDRSRVGAAGRPAGRCQRRLLREKENLVKPEPPIFIPGKYTDRGKWMDGWESRRRR